MTNCDGGVHGARVIPAIGVHQHGHWHADIFGATDNDTVFAEGVDAGALEELLDAEGRAGD